MWRVNTATAWGVRNLFSDTGTPGNNGCAPSLSSSGSCPVKTPTIN